VRAVVLLTIHPRWEPYALTRSYGSVRGAVSNDCPYRDTRPVENCSDELAEGEKTQLAKLHNVVLSEDSDIPRIKVFQVKFMR
jgi:hypothetical protein